MLISNNRHRLSFAQLHLCKFQAITDQASISGVWVKKVYRPVLSLFCVIAERPRNLEFDCPASFDKKIGRPLCYNFAEVVSLVA